MDTLSYYVACDRRSVETYDKLREMISDYDHALDFDNVLYDAMHAACCDAAESKSKMEAAIRKFEQTLHRFRADLGY